MIRCSVLLMPVGIMDELPVELLGLLRIELLAAVGALEGARRPDADVHNGAVSGLGLGADLQGLRHPVEGRSSLGARLGSGQPLSKTLSLGQLLYIQTRQTYITNIMTHAMTNAMINA